MSINFIINDPAAPAAAPTVVGPSPNRPAGRAGFKVSKLPSEDVYPTDTLDFVAWQAREAAIRTMEIFESIADPIVGWSGQASKKSIRLEPDSGVDINAYYDRASVSFFHFPEGSKTTFSGASTDVVAHEVGHAILDALRPQLWNTHFFEVNAFHEGFGDCIAIMVALSDAGTRTAIVGADYNLTSGNFAEATAEDLSAAIGRAAGPNHNASRPRRGLNTHKWTLPASLPDDGGPDVLIEEIHSFGQLTSGCYYDLILEIFRSSAGGEAALWQACQTATALLAEAVATAPIRARFLETVGRTMILVDRKRNPSPAGDGAGQHEAFIRTAFDNHGIRLSVTSFLAPRTSLLPGRRARQARGAAARPQGQALPAAAKRFVLSMFDVGAEARVTTRGFDLGDSNVAQVSVQKPVDLTGLSERLANVRAYTPAEVLVGPVDGSPALLGAVEPGILVSQEVRSYVALLVERGLIDFGAATKTETRRRVSTAKSVSKDKGSRKSGTKTSKAKKAGAAPTRKPAKKSRTRGAGLFGLRNKPSYGLKRSGKEVVLERLRFVCGCHSRSFHCTSA